MRFMSMFSGIGAPEVAWSALGWEPVAFAEIEPFPSAVLKHHFPHVPNLGDVTKADFDAVGQVDAIVFGSPCQSFSVAGKRLGMDDPRGNLALVAGGVVYAKRPRWFVFENVPGLLSSEGGEDFGTLLASYAGYPSGSLFSPPAEGWRNSGIVPPANADSYGLAWRVLDAQFTRTRIFPFAVPQRRRRVFVVGYFGDWRPPAAVFFERESLLGNPPPRREAGQGLAADVAPSLTGSGRGVERAGETRGQDPVIAVAGSDAPSLTATYGEQTGQDYANGLMVAHSLRGEGFDASEDGTGRGTPLGPAAMAFDVKNGLAPHGAAQIFDAAFPLKQSDHKDVQVVAFGGNNTEGPITVSTAINAHGGPMGRLDFESETFIAHPVAFALRGREDGAVPEVEGDGHAAGAIRAASGGSTRDYIAFTAKDHGADATEELAPTVPSGVRRLTPLECSRLQGFPDDFAAVPYRGKNRPADGPMYKAYGNSMAVNVLSYIGERIQMVESILQRQNGGGE